MNSESQKVTHLSGEICQDPNWNKYWTKTAFMLAFSQLTSAFTFVLWQFFFWKMPSPKQLLLIYDEPPKGEIAAICEIAKAGILRQAVESYQKTLVRREPSSYNQGQCSAFNFRYKTETHFTLSTWIHFWGFWNVNLSLGISRKRSWRAFEIWKFSLLLLLFPDPNLEKFVGSCGSNKLIHN